MAERLVDRPEAEAQRSTQPLVELPAPRATVIPATDLGGVGVLKHGNLYLMADAFGDIHPDSRGLGLYELDTRVLSCAILRANGERPTLLSGQTGANHLGTFQLTMPELRRDPATKQRTEEALGRRATAIVRRRWIAGGLAERIEVTNYSGRPQEVILELELDADGADVFEVRGRVRDRRGACLPTLVDHETVIFTYDGLDGLRRRTVVRFNPAEVGPSGGDPLAGEGSVRVRWILAIEPGSHGEVGWETTTELVETPGAEALRAAAQPVVPRTVRVQNGTAPVTTGGHSIGEPAEAQAAYEAWTGGCARIQSDGELLDLTVRRGIADLRLLRNDGPRPDEHYLAAGVPWFTTLFGRDSIITALQVVPFMPDVAREALDVLAEWQATEDDPARDMEPGKILHELRFGELARTGELPHRPYYGSVDATPLWLVLLDETYRWTGDLDLVRRLWPNALAALDWIDRHGDRDGDGFVEYERRTPQGLLNQGWKDSADSVRHRDGSLARTPIALVEVQGYVYDAKVRLAGLARRLGDETLAQRLDAAATELARRFDEAFWMTDAGFYAVALDAEKRQVGTIASNAGHCLWSGIVPPERVDAVVDRLLDPAMDCGWGIRTYAAGQPGFNPVGYHTGSVWPHDNALIAAGMKRVGRHDAADRVASRLFEAARGSPGFRLPELYCGFDRGMAEAPVPYPVACSPQAWAAAAPLSLLQTMLGMRADAAHDRLELQRPHLPTWLGKVTVQELRVGKGRVDLLFHRWRGATTSAEVLRREGPLELVIRV